VREGVSYPLVLWDQVELFDLDGLAVHGEGVGSKIGNGPACREVLAAGAEGETEEAVGRAFVLSRRVYVETIDRGIVVAEGSVLVLSGTGTPTGDLDADFRRAALVDSVGDSIL